MSAPRIITFEGKLHEKSAVRARICTCTTGNPMKCTCFNVYQEILNVFIKVVKDEFNTDGLVCIPGKEKEQLLDLFLIDDRLEMLNFIVTLCQGDGTKIYRHLIGDDDKFRHTFTAEEKERAEKFMNGDDEDYENEEDEDEDEEENEEDEEDEEDEEEEEETDEENEYDYEDGYMTDEADKGKEIEDDDIENRQVVMLMTQLYM